MMAVSCDLYMYACSMYVYTCVVMDFCIYYDILDTIMITDKMLLHFKHSKLSQILHVDKTGFLSPGDIYAVSISGSYVLCVYIAALKL